MKTPDLGEFDADFFVGDGLRASCSSMRAARSWSSPDKVAVPFIVGETFGYTGAVLQVGGEVISADVAVGAVASSGFGVVSSGMAVVGVALPFPGGQSRGSAGVETHLVGGEVYSGGFGVASSGIGENGFWHGRGLPRCSGCC